MASAARRTSRLGCGADLSGFAATGRAESLACTNCGQGCPPHAEVCTACGVPLQRKSSARPTNQASVLIAVLLVLVVVLLGAVVLLATR